MSSHIKCPCCGRAAGHIVVPDKRWGRLYDERMLELAFDVTEDNGDCRYTFREDETDGRETFECQCGKAIWIASHRNPGQGLNGGGWFIESIESIGKQPEIV